MLLLLLLLLPFALAPAFALPTRTSERTAQNQPQARQAGLGGYGR